MNLFSLFRNEAELDIQQIPLLDLLGGTQMASITVSLRAKSMLQHIHDQIARKTDCVLLADRLLRPGA